MLFILFCAVIVAGSLAYIAAWTVRMMRRVGVRRFMSALATLISALLVSLLNLFVRNRATEDISAHDDYRLIDAVDDIRIAREAQQRSQGGAHVGGDSSY